MGQMRCVMARSALSCVELTDGCIGHPLCPGNDVLLCVLHEIGSRTSYEDERASGRLPPSCHVLCVRVCMCSRVYVTCLVIVCFRVSVYMTWRLCVSHSMEQMIPII